MQTMGIMLIRVPYIVKGFILQSRLIHYPDFSTPLSPDAPMGKLHPSLKYCLCEDEVLMAGSA